MRGEQAASRIEHRAALVPVGWGLSPDPALDIRENGRVLVGGSPLRVIRLNQRAAQLVSDWFAGTPVGRGVSERRLARHFLDAGLAYPRPVRGPSCSEVTIVIPTHDRAHELSNCLPGCAGFATTVVDDGSRDSVKLREVATRFGAAIARRETNGGPGAARNSGFSATTTPFVAFVDSDCCPRRGWLENLLPHFEDPAVGAVAPRIRQLSDGRVGVNGLLSHYDEARSPLDMGGSPGLVRPWTAVPYVPGAVLVVRRTAMPFFDESVSPGEDVDFVWRLGNSGWRVVYDPRVQVQHEATRGASMWTRKRVSYNSSAAWLELRRPGSVPALTASAWSVVPLGLMSCRRPIASAFVAALSVILLYARLKPTVADAGLVSSRIVGLGLRYSGTATMDATRRAWWPLAALAAFRSRKARYLLGASIGAAALQRPRGSRLNLMQWTLLRVTDDVLAGVGLWIGCVRHRTVGPLRPRVSFRGGIPVDSSAERRL